MKRITVQASTRYDVVIGSDILKDCGALIKEAISPCRACIITDDIVSELYLPIVEESLKQQGFGTITYVFANGEASKNTANLSFIVEFLAENNFTRTDIVVALGGGVVGDIAGFAAATYLRGIRFVQIPTTFLAAIDSSVGGKTAVNLKAGKNLWGAFHQPSVVVCDIDCMKTLSRDRFLDGVAEAVKYAVLEDESIVHMIDADLQRTVERCVEIKRDIVSGDEFEKGMRKFLNLGHTFGHAIEAISNFEITHGHAVAIGMVIAAKGGEKLGITKSGTSDKIIKILQSFGLPTSCDYTPVELAGHALGDKKRDGDNITLVIPEYVGKCKLYKLSVDNLEEFIIK